MFLVLQFFLYYTHLDLLNFIIMIEVYYFLIDNYID